MAGQFAADPAILALIVQEVGRSLDDATDALVRVAADSSETTALGAARRALTQVRGAFEVVGLRGVPRLIQEIHALLQDVDGAAPGLAAGTASLCTRAF